MIVQVPKYKHINESFFDDIENDIIKDNPEYIDRLYIQDMLKCKTIDELTESIIEKTDIKELFRLCVQHKKILDCLQIYNDFINRNSNNYTCSFSKYPTYNSIYLLTLNPTNRELNYKITLQVNIMTNIVQISIIDVRTNHSKWITEYRIWVKEGKTFDELLNDFTDKLTILLKDSYNLHLNESFFDDLEDDLFNDSDESISSLINTKYEEETVLPELKNLLEKWSINDYEYECTGNGIRVDVNESLYLPNMKLNKFSFNDWYFGTVNGDVYYTGNNLTSWKAFPENIKGNCYAALNKLKNFNGAPNVSGKMIAEKQNTKTDYPLTQENYNNRFRIGTNENSVYVISQDTFGTLKDINESKKYCVVKLDNGNIVKCRLNDVNCLAPITDLLI